MINESTTAKLFADYLNSNINKELFKFLDDNTTFVGILKNLVYQCNMTFDRESIGCILDLQGEELDIAIEFYTNLKDHYINIIKENSYKFFDIPEVNNIIFDGKAKTASEIIKILPEYNIYHYYLYKNLPDFYNELFNMLLLIKYVALVNIKESAKDSNLSITLNKLYNDIIYFLNDITDYDQFVKYYFDFLIHFAARCSPTLLYNILEGGCFYQLDDIEEHKAFKKFILASFLCSSDFILQHTKLMVLGHMINIFSLNDNDICDKGILVLNHKNSTIDTISDGKEKGEKIAIKPNDIGIYTEFNLSDTKFLIGISKDIYHLIDLVKLDEVGAITSIMSNLNIKKELSQIFIYDNLEDFFVHLYFLEVAILCADNVNEDYKHAKEKDFDDVTEERKEFITYVGKLFNIKVRETLYDRVKLAEYIGAYANGVVENDFSIYTSLDF